MNSQWVFFCVFFSKIKLTCLVSIYRFGHIGVIKEGMLTLIKVGGEASFRMGKVYM